VQDGHVVAYASR
jgi:hypothetical protein